MDKNVKKKGEHERSIEKAKNMIDKGIGSIEIMNSTGLNEYDIKKIHKKNEQKLNDW